jgi:hypothetical protein
MIFSLVRKAEMFHVDSGNVLPIFHTPALQRSVASSLHNLRLKSWFYLISGKSLLISKRVMAPRVPDCALLA